MNNESKVQLRYEESMIKTKILDIAAMLDVDEQYKRDQAVRDLVAIVDWMEAKD